ncbi:helix-hairpin-helix domain-containing protein [Halopenitus persicus]|uniref:helix-hairpin-helix domain-containing protein n=1 Tax=Halopenitus persicus TaxID=1048396 RepID=UPI000BBB4084|nr:helix-hairpin-helix domain-containing protein [Halopenitus persicus]
MSEQASLDSFVGDGETEEETSDEDTDNTSGATLMTPEEAVEQGHLDVERALERGSVSEEWAIENGHIEPAEERDPEELDWEDYREHVKDDPKAYCLEHLDGWTYGEVVQAVSDRASNLTELNGILIIPKQDLIDRVDSLTCSKATEIHQRFLWDIDEDTGMVSVLGREKCHTKERWRLKEHQAKRLLYHFGSMERIAEASKEELEEVPGVGPATAERIVEDDVEYN